MSINVSPDGNLADATFKIIDTKLYAPVVTLSTQDDNKQLTTGFKRTIKWSKYRSEITNENKNENLGYLIDPMFNKVHRLFVLSFKDENENDRLSFEKYYVPNLEIKDYNFVINGKSFFDDPIKNKEESYIKQE